MQAQSSGSSRISGKSVFHTGYLLITPIFYWQNEGQQHNGPELTQLTPGRAEVNPYVLSQCLRCRNPRYLLFPPTDITAHTVGKIIFCWIKVHWRKNASTPFLVVRNQTQSYVFPEMSVHNALLRWHVSIMYHVIWTDFLKGLCENETFGI